MRKQRDQVSSVAVKLMALGGALALLPTLLGKSPYTAAFLKARPVAFGMLLVGLLLWLFDRFRRPSRPAAAIEPSFNRAGAAHPAAKPLIQWNADVFDMIEWRRFEALVEAMAQQAGYLTKSQSHGADEGVDIWVYQSNEPDKPTSLIQCKHWLGRRVGVDKVREFLGVMTSFKVEHGQFITSSSFTHDAEDFAKENGITLVDRNRLLRSIAKRSPEQQQALLDVALEGDYWIPTCVNCGIKMVARTPRGGGRDFWGCINYPRCRTTMLMRDTESAQW